MSFLFPFLIPIGLHFCPTSGHTNTANFYFDHTFRNSEQQPVLEHVIWIGGRMCRLDSIALYYKQITTYYPVWWNPNQPKYSDTSAYPRLVFSTPKYDYFFSIIMFFVWERFARKISKKENIFRFLNDNGPSGVTRFGEVSPLYHNIKILWPFWKGSISICQSFELTLANFLCYRANSLCR